MDCNIGYKKILFSSLFVFFALMTKSQIRTDGYYYNISKSKAGDTLINILQFANNGVSMDSIAYGVMPVLRNGLVNGNNRMGYSYIKEGDEIIVTFEMMNLGPYDVSDCPCKNKIQVHDDGFTIIAWRQRDKGWKKSKNKYLFVPFSRS